MYPWLHVALNASEHQTLSFAKLKCYVNMMCTATLVINHAPIRTYTNANTGGNIDSRRSIPTSLYVQQKPCAVSLRMFYYRAMYEADNVCCFVARETEPQHVAGYTRTCAYVRAGRGPATFDTFHAKAWRHRCVRVHVWSCTLLRTFTRTRR